jgi:RNA polymerase sigma-70 factor (ECF subfamily)
MRRIAVGCFRDERTDHTLSPTALVHEAWMRLDRQTRRVGWNDRRHFFASATRAMRRVLIDHARRHGALKRGGGQSRLPIELVDPVDPFEPGGTLALDQALVRLERWNPELGEVVRLRFHAGLTCERAAKLMGIPLRTFKRRWTLARAFLLRDLNGRARSSPARNAGDGDGSFDILLAAGARFTASRGS